MHDAAFLAMTMPAGRSDQNPLAQRPADLRNHFAPGVWTFQVGGNAAGNAQRDGHAVSVRSRRGIEAVGGMYIALPLVVTDARASGGYAALGYRQIHGAPDMGGTIG